MSDDLFAIDATVWDRVIGQERAVANLRACAVDPVHAYLFVGPPGSTKDVAARAFAAVLLAGDESANSRTGRLALAGEHPDVREVRRVGASLDKDPHEVASMFDAVARRYDITNTVLSLGQDRYWRRETRAALRIEPGNSVLDLAAGTAVSTVELAKSGAWCVAADFSVGMLRAGAGRPVPKVAGDATRLPFGDEAFDAVTISFGLRNVVDFEAGLREMARVTRRGGRLVVCEFSTPAVPVFSTLYKEYLMKALPRVARAVSSNPEAYVYLAESIRAWPDQSALAGRIARAGWTAVRWRNLTGGIVALHAAVKS